MRPRRLRVKGYTAFVEEADVDFDGLDLFAITGPTGAGKTSLLQAMTIALYGRAPKLGDDLRQLISPLADQAHFHLEFRARGRSYRIARVLHRTRPTTVAFEAQGDDGEWLTLTRGVREANARVEQILGLDFDSFTKVVLLPQNEFDAFLRGKPDERRSILTRLLSLEVYGRIQQRANQVAGDARTEADLLGNLLERDYAEATQERLAQVRQAGAAAGAAVETLTARVGELERAVVAALEARQHRVAHRQAIDDVAATQRMLEGTRAQHEETERALLDAERDVRTIAERLASIPYDADRHLLLVRASERATRLGQVLVDLARLDVDDARGRARLDEFIRQRDAARRETADAEAALAKALEAEGRIRVDLQEQKRQFGTRAAIAALIERERRYREDREQEENVERALQALIEREAALVATRDELGGQHARASLRLEQARRAREEQDRAFEARRTMHGRAAAIGERLDHARHRTSRAQVAVEHAREEAERKRASLVEAEHLRHPAQDIVRAAEAEVRRLEHLHAAHALRTTLVVGQPCPVCEAKVMEVPSAEPVQDLERAGASLEDARNQLVQAQDAERRAAADVAVADGTLSSSTSVWDEAKADVDRLVGELRRVLPMELYDDARWPQTLQARVNAAATEREAAEQDVDEASRLVAGIAAEIAANEAELRTLPVQIGERRQTRRSIRERCRETEQALEALFGRRPDPDAADELAAIDASLYQAEETLVLATGDLQQARNQLQQAQEDVTAAERNVETEVERARVCSAERGRLTPERDEIHRALEEVVPGRADIVEAITTEVKAHADARSRRDKVARELELRQRERDESAQQVAERAARIRALEHQLEEQEGRLQVAGEALEATLADLTARLAEGGLTLVVDAGDEYEQLTSVVQRAQVERDGSVRRAAELGVEEQALLEKIARAAELREQLEAARRRAEVARELGYLLGANNLQTYVLRDAMRVLVEDGSVYLQRLSDGRYRLQAEDLDFHVVDRWNADAVRSVNTLSGGETFLTSLALALALAERLADLAAGAHGHEALESLFVDEGFGSLDTDETLETVIQAIEALQAHDRVVGIVTHLTPLAERMPAQIKVLKAPEGSRVEMVK